MSTKNKKSEQKADKFVGGGTSMQVKAKDLVTDFEINHKGKDVKVLAVSQPHGGKVDVHTSDGDLTFKEDQEIEGRMPSKNEHGRSVA
jgi:hypothetical protein